MDLSDPETMEPEFEDVELSFEEAGSISEDVFESAENVSYEEDTKTDIPYTSDADDSKEEQEKLPQSDQLKPKDSFSNKPDQSELQKQEDAEIQEKTKESEEQTHADDEKKHIQQENTEIHEFW